MLVEGNGGENGPHPCWEELHSHGNDNGIVVEGMLHLGSPPNILRQIISIGCEDQWKNYMRLAMKSQLQCLDLVVPRVLVDPTPHRFCPPMVQHAHFDPSIRDLDIDVEVVPTVSHA